MMRRLVLASLLAVIPLVIWSVPGASGETSAPEEHCAVYLDPTDDDPQTKVVETEEVSLGCYDTPAEAIDAGEGSSTSTARTPARRTPLDDPEKGSVHIGTEWNQTNYDGDSKAYFFNRDCNDNPIEVNIGAAWNDRFESGKGFGSCDANKKFRHDDQQGDMILCTPNCATYGSLNNEVSSLRWKA